MKKLKDLITEDVKPLKFKTVVTDDSKWVLGKTSVRKKTDVYANGQLVATINTYSATVGSNDPRSRLRSKSAIVSSLRWNDPGLINLGVTKEDIGRGKYFRDDSPNINGGGPFYKNSLKDVKDPLIAYFNKNVK